ncbi:polysaccharide deacetylase family protein [Vibrio alfacsensis]|uniref:polysaccharide deacetylase family protein n=1 Tax=Vibrio TaxID=662 RepID=UPI004068260C
MDKNKKLTYILTFDYELFGSGKGCVFENLINPTNKILDILNVYKVNATFFLEYLEIEAIINRANQFPENQFFKSEKEAIEAQIKRMVGDGHDIQLHLHPQWYRATYCDNNWKLDFDLWRFSSLPVRSSRNNTPSKLSLLHDGKRFLENLIRKYNPDYKCMGFRAGGYNLGFSESSYNALSESGFKYDSSLCPGYVSNTKLSAFDYSTYQSDLIFSLNEHVIEFPLLTLECGFLKKLSLSRIYSNLKYHKIKKVQGGIPINENEAVINGISHSNSNFDICLSSRWQIKSFMKKSLEKENPVSTLIGHPKDYSCFSPMKFIIKSIIKNKGKFKTMTQQFYANHTKQSSS